MVEALLQHAATQLWLNVLYHFIRSFASPLFGKDMKGKQCQIKLPVHFLHICKAPEVPASEEQAAVVSGVSLDGMFTEQFRWLRQMQMMNQESPRLGHKSAEFLADRFGASTGSWNGFVQVSTRRVQASQRHEKTVVRDLGVVFQNRCLRLKTVIMADGLKCSS